MVLKLRLSILTQPTLSETPVTELTTALIHQLMLIKRNPIQIPMLNLQTKSNKRLKLKPIKSKKLRPQMNKTTESERKQNKRRNKLKVLQASRLKLLKNTSAVSKGKSIK